MTTRSHPSRSRPRWTITALTVPQRDAYLRKMIESINAAPPEDGAELLIIYNTRTPENPFDVEARIQQYSRHLPVSVHINTREPTIAEGRNLQLMLCKSPLICFVDDDITIHGDIFPAIEATLRRAPLGLVGLPSYQENTNTRVKPRDTSPHVDHLELRFMQIQGMLAAGYRDLLLDVGGFNPRRRFWGEWTELNTRLWRSGFPTAYQMNAGYLRHWEDAPESPTRNMDGREAHVLWGLICTALEYDAVDATEATTTFWRLVEQRYLAYSFGEELSLQQLLRTTLELMPRISAEWSQIAAFKEEVAQHPFAFKPFHPLSLDEVKQVLEHAHTAIGPYRSVLRARGPYTPLFAPIGSENGSLGRFRRVIQGMRRLMKPGPTQDIADESPIGAAS